MELDKADIAILRALQEDARRSMRELARAGGVSTPTASARVRSLEAKGVLRGYSATIAPEALGEHVLFMTAKVRPKDARAAAAALAARPEIRAVHLLGAGRIAARATLVDAGRESEFLMSLSSVQEIVGLDVYPLLESVKDQPLAVVDRGVRLAIRCELCGRRTKDEPLRVRAAGVTHFVCCATCKKGFLERVERLAKLAGKGVARSDLRVVEG